MQPKWLIETTGIPEDVQPIFEALENQNIEYKEIDKHFIFTRGVDDIHKIYNEDECVIFFGTLESAKRIRRVAKWIPGVYYNVQALNCDHYYPHIGSRLLNRDYIMLPYGDLIRQKEFLYEHLGEDRAIFLRPNRGDKLFTGKVFHKEDFEKEIELLNYNQIDPQELIVASKPINLEKEWRFVCVKSEIITGSSYKENNVVGSEAGYPDEALQLATEVAKMYDPDPCWIIDICKTKSGRYAVVEVGCFSCAGLYKCDREVIVKEVSKAALGEWQSYRE